MDGPFLFNKNHIFRLLEFLIIYFENKRIKMKNALGKSVFDLLYAPTFPGSSVVEQLTVNQLVASSNLARGAIFSLLCKTTTDKFAI